MGDGERIVVRKVLVGKATLLGVYLGFVLGILKGLLVFMTLSFIPTTFTVGGKAVALSRWVDIPSLTPLLSGGVFLAVWIGTVLVFFLGSVLYNLFAKMGGAQHVMLDEYTETTPVAQAQPVQSS